MRKFGFTIIEMIIVLAVIAVGCTITLPTLAHLIYKFSATLSMQQVQLAVEYARSVAVATSNIVTICPSAETMQCGESWQQGVSVVSSIGIKRYKVFGSGGIELSLLQSGFSKQKLLIEPDGMTYTNGHFNYKSTKFCDFAQFNLYFNKGLRFYLIKG